MVAFTMSTREKKRLQKGAPNAALARASKSSLSGTSIANAELVLKAKNGGDSDTSPDIEMADAEPLAEQSNVNKLAVPLVKGTKPLAALLADTTSGADTPMGDEEPDVPVEDINFIDDIIVGEVALYGDEGAQHVQRILDSPKLCKHIRTDPVILLMVVGRVVFAAGYEVCAKVDKLGWQPYLVRTLLDSLDRGDFAKKICDLHHVLTDRKLEFSYELYMAQQTAYRTYRKKEGTTIEQHREAIMRKPTIPEVTKPKAHNVFGPKTNASGLMAPLLTKQTSVEMSGIMETLPVTEMSAGIEASAINKAATTTKTSNTPKTASSIDKGASITTKVTPVTNEGPSATQMTFPVRSR